MRWFDRVKDSMTGAFVGFRTGRTGIESALQQSEVASALIDVRESSVEKAVTEGLADLELAIDDIGWKQMGGSGLWEFSRNAIRKMIALSRMMYLINPLIKRAVTVQELYVWGSGCTITAESPAVQEVLNDFFNAEKNQAVVGDNWPEREREQRIDGNSFFAFFVNPQNGTSRIRVIPVDQVDDIICNPEDMKEPWLYKRNLSELQDPITGTYASSNKDQWVLYPAIDYNPRLKPASDKDGIRIDWSVRVMHIKTGGLSTMKFGVPELYSTLNWATAYKKILENFATILQAYARIAMKISGLGGKKGTAAAKSKMGTGVTTGDPYDSNPPNTVAALFASSGGADISAVKTANMTTGPEEARALRSMVAAGSDTPEHFFGDSDIGNFATSETLDRPTELKMIARQDMWSDIILRMSRYLIIWSARAPSGRLRKAGFKATEEQDPFDRTLVWVATPPSGQNLNLAVEFPAIVERNIIERVRATVQVATLNGSKAEGIIPDRKFLFELLMAALGKKNIKALSDRLYPKTVEQGFIDPAAELEIKKKQAEKPEPQPVAAGANGNNGR